MKMQPSGTLSSATGERAGERGDGMIDLWGKQATCGTLRRIGAPGPPARGPEPEQ
jgi:hypothetical protein